MSKKALLMILDGWGIGDQGKDDVIFIRLKVNRLREILVET
jgi:bisphosphoglycerate-independent phosphoglycerate mutase (AlkP superfamily)